MLIQPCEPFFAMGELHSQQREVVMVGSFVTPDLQFVQEIRQR